jgi:hypothetical protein
MGAFLLKRWINCRALSRLGSANLVRPRRCLNGPSHMRLAIAEGDRRDKALHPSQIA